MIVCHFTRSKVNSWSPLQTCLIPSLPYLRWYRVLSSYPEQNSWSHHWLCPLSLFPFNPPANPDSSPFEICPESNISHHLHCTHNDSSHYYLLPVIYLSGHLTDFSVSTRALVYSLFSTQQPERSCYNLCYSNSIQNSLMPLHFTRAKCPTMAYKAQNHLHLHLSITSLTSSPVPHPTYPCLSSHVAPLLLLEHTHLRASALALLSEIA